MNSKKNKIQILTFEIAGQYAHFKKFYSNSSSLSYYIPPRTVLMGMLASILEKKTDEYYEIFSPSKCKLSVAIKSNIKKQMEGINYLMKKKKGHTQIPLELLMAVNKKIIYRLYIVHKDETILQNLKEKLEKGNLGYGLYFGQRQFRAYLNSEVSLLEGVVFHNLKSSISTVTWVKNIIDLDLSNSGELNQLTILSNYMKEANVIIGRVPKEMISIIYPRTKYLTGKFKEVIKLNELNENIVFFTPINKEF